MQIDWKMMAQARGLHLEGAELDRIASILSSIESAFAPLAATIPHEVEPAVILSDAAIVGE